ncbi:MAG: hypothetical protein RJA10_664 [Pseudomonadota bacterium]|jgi:hypothetical protein
MTLIRPSRLLTGALWLDIVGSAPVALAQALAADRLAPLLNLPQPLLQQTGWVMVAYVATLLWLVRRPQMPLALLRAIIVGNSLWALVALGLLLSLSPGLAGQLLLALHLAPGLFAMLQQRGLRQSHPAAAPLRTANA